MVSSAHILGLENKLHEGRSFTYIVNKRGPRIEPCGIPQVKLQKSEICCHPIRGDLTTQLVKKLKRKLRRYLVDPNVDIRMKEKTTKPCFFTRTKDKTLPLSQSNVVHKKAISELLFVSVSK